MARAMNYERAAKREAVARPVDTSATDWWWVPAKGLCTSCGNRTVGLTAYCHTLQQNLCEVCVDAMGVVPKMSKRALAATRSNTKRRK